MSVYRCDKCENYIDADFQGCNDHPFKNDLNICDVCLYYIEGDTYEE